MKQVFTLEYEEEPGYVLADLKPVEVDLLKRVIGVCREAKESGNHPFGCLIADRDGKIIMEQGNAEHDLHGDCTAHAETQLIRRATQIYSKEEMSQFTFYNCGDPCAMCAGAIMHSRIARVVYGAADPKTGVAGSVVDLFAEPRLNHHATIERGVLGDECGRMLSSFFAARRSKTLVA